MVSRRLYRSINKVIQSKLETKFCPRAFGFNSSTTAELEGFVYWPDQGTGAYDHEADEASFGNRIGNRVEIQSIQFNYNVTTEGVGLLSDSNNFTNIRVIIFQWMNDTEEYVPTVDDILYDYTEASSGYGYLSVYNPAESEKYRILYDRTHDLSNVAGSPTTQTVNVTFTSFPQRLIEFCGDEEFGTDANIVKGALYYLVVSNAASLDVSYPTFNGQTMLKFKDG